MLEVACSVGRAYVHVYQALVVWGDQVATYVARECVRKRMDKVLVRVREFPLAATPSSIVETFWWAEYELGTLGQPPGASAADRALLASIEERWLQLSTSDAH